MPFAHKSTTWRWWNCETWARSRQESANVKLVSVDCVNDNQIRLELLRKSLLNSIRYHANSKHQIVMMMVKTSRNQRGFRRQLTTQSMILRKISAFHRALLTSQRNPIEIDISWSGKNSEKDINFLEVAEVWIDDVTESETFQFTFCALTSLVAVQC